MKINMLYASYLLFLLAFAATGCSDEEKLEIPVISQPDESYTSYYYYSYEAVRQLSGKDFSQENATFKPGPACFRGDTLIVANIHNNNNSLELYDVAQNRHLLSFKSWKYGELTQQFPNKIEALALSGNRLYVANLNSQIDVFDAQTLEFITRIGTGQWGENATQLLHSHAMVVTPDGEIIVRTKKTLLVYREMDVTPEKYGKVSYYCRSKTDGMDVNNGFYSHQMVQDTTGVVFLADYGESGNRKVQVVDTALIAKGDSKILIDTKRTMSLSFYPCGIALHNDRIILSDQNGNINIYDRTKENWMDGFKSVVGFTFNKPEKLLIRGNSLWVSDVNAGKLVEVNMHLGEIREYDK